MVTNAAEALRRALEEWDREADARELVIKRWIAEFWARNLRRIGQINES